MTPEEQVFSELETGYKILKGPPVPSLLPEKGLGVFLEEGHIHFFVMARFNASDTVVRTPISAKNGLRLLWNIVRGRYGNPQQP